MEKVLASSLRPGDAVLIDQKSFVIISNQHVKPGKGGAFAQLVMKPLTQSSSRINKKLRSVDSVVKLTVYSTTYQVLFTDSDELHLMDMESLETITLPISLVRKDHHPFLKSELKITTKSYNDKVFSVHLPVTINVKIKRTDASTKNQTVSSSYKPATLENDIKIMVPQFINSEEWITILTDDLTYSSRVK